MNEQLNSTLGNIAATIEETYNNGRTVSSDEKLSYEDFLQLCFLNYGEIAPIQYYNELRRGNAEFYFSQSIVNIEVKITKGEKGRPPYFNIDDYALLPYMAGILAVYPKTKEGLRDPDNDYLKMKPGAEGLYGKPKILDDLGLRFYSTKGERFELYGGDDNCEGLYVDYIPLSENTVVPAGIGKIMIREILMVVLPGKAAPIDTHEDMDPNQQTYKLRLDQPQQIQ